MLTPEAKTTAPPSATAADGRPAPHGLSLKTIEREHIRRVLVGRRTVNSAFYAAYAPPLEKAGEDSVNARVFKGLRIGA